MNRQLRVIGQKASLFSVFCFSALSAFLLFCSLPVLLRLVDAALSVYVRRSRVIRLPKNKQRTALQAVRSGSFPSRLPVVRGPLLVLRQTNPLSIGSRA